MSLTFKGAEGFVTKLLGTPPARRATVLHVITRLDLGGAQDHALYVVQNLDRQRFQAKLVCGVGGARDGDAIRTGQVIFQRELVHPMRPVSDAAALMGLRRTIAAYRSRSPGPLIVHTHCSKAGVLGRIAARVAGADLVVHTFHGLFYHPSRLSRSASLALEWSLRPCADALFFVSRSDLARLTQRGLAPESRSFLVRSGIERREFRPCAEQRRAVRDELGLFESARVVITVANFKRVKNPLLALRAFARIAAHDSRAFWIVIGGGDCREFDAAVAQARLGSRIRRLGWRRDVARLLNAGDVFMLSSDYEGMPHSVLEALAMGLPVVATRAGDIPSVVGDSLGMTVACGDAAGLAEGVFSMFRKPPDVKQNAAGILAEFDAAAMVTRYEELYDQLLRRTPGR